MVFPDFEIIRFVKFFFEKELPDDKLSINDQLLLLTQLIDQHSAATPGDPSTSQSLLFDSDEDLSSII